jgi:peptidoglycan/LPS O-acetylase OafA/YrhL
MNRLPAGWNLPPISAGSARLDAGREIRLIHRTDIDGLRAIAVLLVILHHYGVPGFGGGFIGVDVFFVISGFLIGGNIARDIRAGRFSLLDFYDRRIRRILPALFVMYALVLAAGTVVLFAPDLHFLSRIGAYVIAFLGNYALYRNAGLYGGQFADHVVLLHTWSLAVEEQFYLLFPLLMVATSALFRRRYAAVLWPLTLISFVSCIVVVRISPMTAFYLAPFRAWELLAGALLATGTITAPAVSSVRTAAAVLGLVLVAAADVLSGSSSPNPGELTLVPCAGACLILYASCDRGSVTGKLLGNGIMRRIGLWSYSLYLYHWPLLLLAQYYALEPLSLWIRCWLVAGTFLLGALSWRYVEQPFRRRRAPVNRRRSFALAAVSGVVLMAATFTLHRQTEPTRYSALERVRFPSQTADQLRCKETSPEMGKGPACVLGDASAPITTLVWGDSHAVAILPAINEVAARHRQAAMFAEMGRCPPLLGAFVRDLAPGQSAAVRSWMDARGLGHGVQCKRHNDAVLEWVLQNHVATVLLVGHWIANTEDSYQSVLSDDEGGNNHASQQNAAVFRRGLERLLAVLEREHVRVFLLEDAPQNEWNVPYALAARRRLGLTRDIGISRAAYDAQQRSAAQIFTDLHARYGLRLLRPQDILCAGGECAADRGGVPLYVDNEHLSADGALLLTPILDAVVDGRP